MNVGKKFEQNFKASVPEDTYYVRLKDNASMFAADARYSVTNPYDCLLFRYNMLVCLELKSTGSGYFTFEREKDQKKKGMIHYHQIKGLLEAYDKRIFGNIHAGFIFNFRNDEAGTEVTYYQEVSDFIEMIGSFNKNSFKVADLLKFNPVRIGSEKKRVNYRYDIEGFLNVLEDKSMVGIKGE